jgi:pyridoxal phosphate enzyme (YggS family)
MDEAALAAGRDPKDVLLCAATKMNDADRVKEAVAAGVDCCGENRVQELMQKQPLGAYEGVPVHFIGHLQTNKVKYLVGQVALIHSVESERLAAEISRRAEALGLRQPCLLEVNIGAEENKRGCAEADLPSLAAYAAGLPGLDVRGLMTVPPIGTPEEADGWFARMKELYDGLAPAYGYTVLSMGMSGDFPAAVRRGATVVRVGTAIFGPRDYGPAR